MESNRARDWDVFSDDVRTHIDGYVVPQYGDAPDDPMSSWNVGECVKNAAKYLARHGRNSRPGQEKLDLLKAAHCIQIAYLKLIHGERHGDVPQRPDQAD